MKIKILILIAAVLACGCDKMDRPRPVEDDKENAKMDNMEMALHQIMKQCRSTDPQTLESMFKKLNDPGFLSQLDANTVYEDASNPPTLLEVLKCLAENPNQPVVAAGLGKLADSPLYAHNDAKGALRRNVLIIASGYLTQPGAKILAFLENEVVKYSDKREFAVNALSRIGTPQSMTILTKHIFNPSTCVIPKHLREIYLTNFTLELAEFRNRPTVLSFLLDQLYQTKLRNEVLVCLIEDQIARDAERITLIIAAPLNRETANSVVLAKLIAVWLIQNSTDLEEYQYVPITRRVPDLLGIENAQTPPQEGSAIKKWAANLFQQAWKQSDDPERKQQLQLSLTAFQ